MEQKTLYRQLAQDLKLHTKFQPDYCLDCMRIKGVDCPDEYWNEKNDNGDYKIDKLKCSYRNIFTFDN